MRKRLGFAFLALLAASAAHAADAASCAVRKGLYESWLSPGKHTGHDLPKTGTLMAPTRSAADRSSSHEIGQEYREFFQCLNNAPLTSGDDGGAGLCNPASPDRVAALVCEVALYIRTGRTG